MSRPSEFTKYFPVSSCYDIYSCHLQPRPNFFLPMIKHDLPFFQLFKACGIKHAIKSTPFCVIYLRIQVQLHVILFYGNCINRQFNNVMIYFSCNSKEQIFQLLQIFSFRLKFNIHQSIQACKVATLITLIVPSVCPEKNLSLKQMTDRTSPFSLQSSFMSCVCIQMSCSIQELSIIYHAYTRKWYKNTTNLPLQIHFLQPEPLAFQLLEDRISLALSTLL